MSGLSGYLLNNLRGERADLREVAEAIVSPCGSKKHGLTRRLPTGTRSTFQFATSRGERHCSPALEKVKQRGLLVIFLF
jgi:hypothetical protein